MNKNVLVIAVTVAIATVGVAQASPLIQSPAIDHQAHAQLSSAQRGELVGQLVRTWGPYVQKVHGTSAGAWASRMQGTFNAATDANLQRAVSMKTFQGAVDALTGVRLSDAEVTDSLATQAQVLGSNPSTALLGSTTSDLVYTPLAPCRLADTRVVGGPIAGGFSRGFHGYTATNFAAQGGIATSDCGIPANPSALMLNFTVVSPTGAGYLTVFPYGTAMPHAANLNYGVGSVVGNEIAAKMTLGSATDEFSVYAQGSTHVVIDVVGYFMAPVATPLSNVQGSFTDSVAANSYGSFEHSCAAGYVNAGGGCWSNNAGLSIIGNVALDVRQYCVFYNSTGAALNAITYTNCVKVPGR